MAYRGGKCARSADRCKLPHIFSAPFFLRVITLGPSQRDALMEDLKQGALPLIAVGAGELCRGAQMTGVDASLRAAYDRTMHRKGPLNLFPS